MPEGQRLGAMEALGRSIRTHGGKSAAAYRAMGAEDGARMLAVIAGTAPELGGGSGGSGGRGRRWCWR